MTITSVLREFQAKDWTLGGCVMLLITINVSLGVMIANLRTEMKDTTHTSVIARAEIANRVERSELRIVAVERSIQEAANNRGGDLESLAQAIREIRTSIDSVNSTMMDVRIQVAEINEWRRSETGRP